jgi:NAD(P)-dependent dehydrogenase (short-subunit alcohol dehydrogenase family)
MQGKIVLVTGATNGIGKVTALELAKQGARTVIVGRNRTKTEATVKEIQAHSGNPKVEMLLGDLALMADVRRIAAEFKSKYDRLDVLVNNAGAWFTEREETAEGIEMTFALNHLSYFLLTNLLLDVLKANAPARIVNVSSRVHADEPLDFDDLQNTKNYGRNNGLRVYGQSKLANVLFTYELARRLEGTGVTANVLHPGIIGSGFGLNNKGLFTKVAMMLYSRLALSPEEGAKTIIHLAASPEVEGVSGQYWVKCKAVPSSKDSHDVEAQRRLWEVSEQMTGLTVNVS